MQRVLIIQMHARTNPSSKTEPTGVCFREEGRLDVSVERVTCTAVRLLRKLALEVVQTLQSLGDVLELEQAAC